MKRPASGNEGAYYGIAAVLMWGTYPLWYAVVSHVPVFELLWHRIIWSTFFIVPLTFFVFKKKTEILLILSEAKSIMLTLISTLILFVWWYVYTYAVVSGKVIEASLGYFIAPILTFFVGVIVFKEKFNRVQLLSVIAIFGSVIIYIVISGTIVFSAIILAFCYTAYTVLRKINTSADSQAATMLENIIMFPIAIIAMYYLYIDENLYSYIYTDNSEILIFIALGVINVLPMWWYGIAAKKMNLISISIIQYVPPICNFILGVYFFEELINLEKLIMFIGIWAGIALFLVNQNIIQNSLTNRSK